MRTVDGMTHIDRPLLIHVAAEAEGRGRIVLASCAAAPHSVALSAAFDVARAFDTWVDCLLVESPDVVALTAHGFAREVSHSGRIAPLSNAAILEGQSAASSFARKAVLRAAQSTGLRVSTTTVRDGLTDSLARACAIEGPWNIVALAEPVLATDAQRLHRLLDRVSGATGIVCIGPSATPSATNRPVIVVVEDMDRLSQMLRVAERLAKRQPDGPARPIVMLVAGATPDQTAELEGNLRLLMAGIAEHAQSAVTIVDTGHTYATTAEIAEAVRRLDGCFAIVRSNGAALPSNAEAAGLLSILCCPMLLVR